MRAEEFNTLRTVIPFEPSDHLSEYSLFDSSLFDVLENTFYGELYARMNVTWQTLPLWPRTRNVLIHWKRLF